MKAPVALAAPLPTDPVAQAEFVKKNPQFGVPKAFLAEVARDRGAIGPVVGTTEGVVAISGRRVLKLDDGSFVGAATRLDALPSTTPGPDPR